MLRARYTFKAPNDVLSDTMLGTPLSAIRATRPTMPLYPRVVVEAILLCEGPIGTAQAVARELGLPNRFKLARLMKREGLPPLHRLAAWATVLSWVQRAERQGVSLCWIAFRSHRHPSACYRLVREVTGLRWEAVRSKGSVWAHRQFLKVLDTVRNVGSRAH